MINQKKLTIGVLSILIFLIVVQASFAENTENSVDMQNNDSNTGIIYVSQDGNDDNVGTQDKPVQTIAKSIELATDNNNNEHKIFISNGTYHESNLNIASNLEITSKGDVVIDANKKSRIFNIECNNEVKLTGITFINGRDTDGGAILISNAKVTIDNCRFMNNTAAEGGAIYWNGDEGTLTNSYFTQNLARTASAISWGGLEDNAFEKGGKNGKIINTTFENNDNANTRANNMGLALYSNNITVVNSSFINNHGRYGSTGGSLHIYGNYITIDSCLFENNTMDQAPAIQSDGDYSKIINCVFKNNTIDSTESAKGGAVEIDSLNSIIYNNTFIGNGGENCYNGGAIVVFYDGFAGTEVIEIRKNKFIDNSARYGGSIFIEGNYESYAVFKEMVVSDNVFDKGQASTTAGIYVRNVDLEASIVKITNNTFKNLISNHADSIFIDYAAVYLKNNTIINCTSADENNHIFNLEGFISGNLTITVNNNDTVELLAGKTIDVNATVADDMDNSISGGIIRFIVQGSDVDEDGFSLENGTATVRFKSSVVGMFLVSADYTNGDLAFAKTSIIIALPYDIYIKFENQTGLCGETIVVPVTAAVNGYVIDYDNLTVEFNNETFEIEVIGGMAYVNLTLPDIDGTYPLSIIYDIQTENRNITVKDNSVIIDVPEVNVTPNAGKLNITLRDSEGNPLAGHYITVKFANISQNISTDENGFASMDLDLDIGTYPVEVNYIGNKYKSANASSTINVRYLDVILSSSNITMNYGNVESYIVRLTDLNLNPIANQTVNIALAGNVNNLTTDSNGIVSILINQKPGSYVASAVYGGNRIYSQANVNNSIQINSLAKLTASNINMYYSDSKYYKVRVYGDDGKVVGAGVKVKITVNKETYTRTTDKNGYASLKITLTPGTYAVKATYNGAIKSSKITVKKVLTAKNVSKKKSKTIKFTAKLAKGSKVIKNKNVKFKIKGKTYTVKTNKKGIATVNLKNLKVGKYTIFTYYGKSCIKNTITVKK